MAESIYQLIGVKQRSNYFIENVKCNLRLICHICCEILLDPSQAQCGCRFCYQCISKHFTTNTKICPECNMEVSENIIKDRAVEREILNLKIRCLNNGCNHICELKFLSSHLTNCEWRQEKCDKCQQSFPYNLKDKHLEELCMEALCKCDYCRVEMTRNQYETIHINPLNEDTSKLCENLIIECPYKCKIEIFGNIKNHLIKCPNKMKKCDLFQFGCQFLGNLDDMANHAKDNHTNHLLLIINEITNLKAENGALKNKMVDTKIFTQTIKQENLNLENQFNILQIDFNKSRDEIKNIKSEIESYKSVNFKEEIDEDLSVFNGVCTWTIRNIQQKISDAKSGINVQIVSKPFYLYQPGYRFVLKIYPNGDGHGKNNFFSIYFVIFKGEFDEEINWPFQNRVSLSLMSNDLLDHNLSIYMKPDRNIACYGKPETEFNLGAGQPEFVNLTDLMNSNSYVRDGSIRIRFEIISEGSITRTDNVISHAIGKVK